jgi:phosphate transport system ATP-binding protein
MSRRLDTTAWVSPWIDPIASDRIPRNMLGIAMPVASAKQQVPEHLDLFYGEKQALFDVNMQIPEHCVTAFIGPSGCGKSTLLRTFNRMNDLVDGCRSKAGSCWRAITFTTRASMDITTCVVHVGMVFQKPNPFPQIHLRECRLRPAPAGGEQRRVLDEVVEASLQGAALWDEVKDRLHDNAWACPAASSSGW